MDRAENLFVDSTKSARAGNYLGDRSVVSGLLRIAIHDISEGEFGEAVIKKTADRIASIFIGENQNYVPLRKWNEVGGIDVFLKKRFPQIEETAPKAVVVHAFLLMIQAIIEVCSSDDTLREQWEFELEATVTRFSDAFMGLDRFLRISS